MSAEKKQWLAIYSRPRWEKKVAKLLQEKGIECYCPLNKVRRQWSDRIKTVEEPLFKSYVFVRVTESQRASVRMVQGVVNFVYWLGKPAVVKDREIETIQKFLNEYEAVEAHPVHIKPNAKVRIRQGALMDKVGVVKKLRSGRVEVWIDSIGFKLVALVEKYNIELEQNSTYKK